MGVGLRTVATFKVDITTRISHCALSFPDIGHKVA
jgi:hypothetical protein